MLKNSGKDPLDIFQAYDLDNTGMVDIRRFREIVQRLDILLTASQLNNAIENYRSISNPNFVCYEEFCRAIELHALDLHETKIEPKQNPEKTVQDTQTADHPLNSDIIEKWYHDATPREQREFHSVYESLDRFKSLRDSGTESDDYENTTYLLSSTYPPPKPSESVSRLRMNRSSTLGKGGIATIHSYASQSPRFMSPIRSSNDRLSLSGSLNVPRSPPSKVGSVMWGNETPLSRKGNVPKLDDCWVCSVCYFTENPHNTKYCEICQSPNYNDNKEFQIKQQCSNCTFLNGHFARDCEMCGDKL